MAASSLCNTGCDFTECHTVKLIFREASHHGTDASLQARSGRRLHRALLKDIHPLPDYNAQHDNQSAWKRKKIWSVNCICLMMCVVDCSLLHLHLHYTRFLIEVPHRWS